MRHFPMFIKGLKNYWKTQKCLKRQNVYYHKIPTPAVIALLAIKRNYRGHVKKLLSKNSGIYEDKKCIENKHENSNDIYY